MRDNALLAAGASTFSSSTAGREQQAAGGVAAMQPAQPLAEPPAGLPAIPPADVSGQPGAQPEQPHRQADHRPSSLASVPLTQVTSTRTAVIAQLMYIPFAVHALAWISPDSAVHCQQDAAAVRIQSAVQGHLSRSATQLALEAESRLLRTALQV